MPDITGDKSAPVKKQFNPRPQESAKAMISVVFVGYRSPFYYYEVTLASTANTSFRPETSVTNSESPETPP